MFMPYPGFDSTNVYMKPFQKYLPMKIYKPSDFVASM